MSRSEGSSELSKSSDSGDLMLLDQLNVTKLQVIGYNSESKRFSVDVELNGCCAWTVVKTYQNFVELQRNVSRRHHLDHPLPKNACKGKRPNQQAVEQMCGQLGAYVNGLLAMMAGPERVLVIPRVLLEFLEYDGHVIDVAGITDNLVDKARDCLAAGGAETIQMSSLELHCVTRRLACLSGDPKYLLCDATCKHLVECVAKMKRIHVIQHRVENLSSSALKALSLDLSAFESLLHLELEGISRPQLTGMECIVLKLQSLAVHQCVQRLSDILVYYSNALDNEVLSQPDFGGATPWASLTCASFKDNDLKLIDPSIRLLPALKKLDLSCNQISEIENISELSSLEVVDLSYNCIKSLQGASNQLSHAKELKLSHNHISCLDGLEKLLPLKIIDLSFNEIGSDVELRHLTLLHFLEELNLHDNPICTSKSYRTLVLSEISPRIGKITLDGKEPSLEEQTTVNSVRSTWYKAKQTTQPVEIPVLLGGQRSEHLDGSLYEVIETPKADPEAEKLSIMWRVNRMREEAGDQWLEKPDLVESIHVSAMTDTVVEKKRRKRHTKRVQKKGLEEQEKANVQSDVEQSVVDSCKASEEPQSSPMKKKKFSDTLQQLVDSKLNKLTQLPAEFSVSVLEYSGPLHHLCPHDIDHLLLHRKQEEGVVTIHCDGEIEEAITSSATALRPRRNLSMLKALHIHEGRFTSVCVGLSDEGVSWVIYVVQDLHVSASLYAAINQAIPQQLNNTGFPHNYLHLESQSTSAENPFIFPTATSVLRRPGLESQELMEYFRCSIAREKNETLLTVEWGVCLLPANFLCGVETGILVSNSSLYLVGVTHHHDNNISWQSGNLPLRLIVEATLDELCQVTCGPCSQYLLLEFSRRVPMQCFVFCPHSCDQCVSLVCQIGAALDGHSIPHETTATRRKEMMGGAKEKDAVRIVSESEDGCARVKEDLVRYALSVKTATCDVLWNEFEGLDTEADLKQESSKVAIVHYMVVWEGLLDLIPSSNGRCGLHLRALVVTQDSVYLCREDVLFRLAMESIPQCPSSLLGFVLDCHPISEIAAFKECDKADLSFSPSNPLYQLSITFSSPTDGSTRSGCSSEWILCVQDSQPVTQLAFSLSKAWCGLHGSPLPHVHTTVPLLDHTPAPSPSLEREDASIQELKFYHNRALLDLCASSYDKKVEFFKEHCSMTSFQRARDSLQGVFIAHGRPSYRSLVEIEVCIVISKSAIYLFSTPDEVQLWNGTKVLSSSDRRLYSETSGSQLQCCHQVWLSDIKEATVGLFYLSVQLNTVKSNGEGVVFVTQHVASTLALLGAIAGAVDLSDAAAKETVLREFDDVTDDPITMSLTTWKLPSQRASVSFRQVQDKEMDSLASLFAKCTFDTAKQHSKKIQLGNTFVLCQQIMVLASNVNTQSTVLPQSHSHLVLLTNHGLYVCVNDSYHHHSPAVFQAEQLSVKKCLLIEHISCIEVTIAQRCIKIYYGNKHTSSSHSGHPKHDTELSAMHSYNTQSTIHLVAQNSELLHSFVYQLSVLWSEKNGGKKLAVRQTYL